MYAHVGADGAKETCSGCSQYLDCAKCSNVKCGDTKCVKCYNKAYAPKSAKINIPKRSTSIIPEDQEF